MIKWISENEISYSEAEEKDRKHRHRKHEEICIFIVIPLQLPSCRKDCVVIRHARPFTNVMVQEHFMKTQESYGWICCLTDCSYPPSWGV